ncbi:hypothetical protein HK099_000353 [Clydaea vesicula]|uniref:Uncharacterized protein n=1 Tax=Clydaea vesicula TaxID=447962 RepID=A0AAD5Y276_9FUNG|nr:hypothetical protein HK099_000353 [Clydaea vesicula]
MHLSFQNKSTNKFYKVDPLPNHIQNANPDTIIPLLVSMKKSKLKVMFQSELIHSLKAISVIANSSIKRKNSNLTTLLAINQFQKVLNTFSAHLPEQYLILNLVQSGEKILDFTGFHHVAKKNCFEKALEVMSKNSTQEGFDLVIAAECSLPDINRKAKYETSFKSLECRARYGIFLSEFLNLRFSDPWFRTSETKKKINALLCGIKEVMVNAIEIEILADVVYSGSVHIFEISKELIKCGLWKMSLPFLVSVNEALENSTFLVGPDKLYSWRTEIAIVTFQCLLKNNLTQQAEQLLQNTINEIQAVFDLEVIANGNEVPAESKVLSALALHKLNIALFGSEIRKISFGKKIAVDTRDSNLKKKSTLKREASLFDTNKEWELSKLKKTSSQQVFESVALSNPTIYSSHHSLLSSSRQSLFRKRNSSAKALNEMIPRFSATRRSTVTGNVTKSVEQHESIDLNYSVGETMEKKKNYVKVVKVKPRQNGGTIISEEFNEANISDMLSSSLLSLIQVFIWQKDQLHAIVEGLTSIIGSEVDLRFREKILDINSTNELTIMKLLDLGFQLLIYGHSHDFQLNKDKMYSTLPSKEDLKDLETESLFQIFDIKDVAAFNRKLFETHEWDRYSIISQFLIEFISNETKKDSELHSYLREIELKISVIKLEKLYHSDRKILFSPEVNVNNSKDFLNSDISEHIHLGIVDFLQSLTGCMESELLKVEHPRIFMDSTLFLWKFVEPYVRELNLLSEVQFKGIDINSSVVQILKALHLLHSEYPTENILIGIVISSKLALISEFYEQFEEAVQILEEILQRIRISREHLSEGSSNINSVTCSIQSHPVLAKEFQTENEEWIEFSTDTVTEINELGYQSSLHYLYSNNSDTSYLLLKLPSLELDVLSSLIRCNMKQKYRSASLTQMKKDYEYQRLHHKKKAHTAVVIKPEKSDIERIAGENLSAQAMIKIIYSCSGKNISIHDRKIFLDDALKLLQSSFVEEERLLREILNHAKIGVNRSSTRSAPQFVKRSYSSITLKMANQDRSIEYFEIYAREATTSNLQVSVKDILLNGTGSPVYNDGAPECTISDLIHNKKYIFAVGAYTSDGKLKDRHIGKTGNGIVSMLPLPLIVCWGNLGNAAHAINHFSVAEYAHKRQLDHFLNYYAPDSILRELSSFLPSKEKLAAPSTFKLNEITVALAPPSAIQNLIQSFYFINERALRENPNSVFCNSEGKGCKLLKAQMCRIHAARDFLICLCLAEKIEDEELAILSVVNCLQYISPMLKVNQPTVFILYVLLACHAGFTKHYTVLDYDRVQAIHDFFVPLTYYLLKFLAFLGEHQTLVKVAIESLELINKACPTADSTIYNSNVYETKLLGRITEKKFVKYSKNSPIHTAEFLYQKLLALNSDSKFGLASIRSWSEKICEYLETLVVIYTSQNVTHLQTLHDTNVLNTARMLAANFGTESVCTTYTESQRRSLDVNTSIRELYSVLIHIGAEATFQQLANFKKNPRYIELVVRCVGWAIYQNNFEAASKIYIEIVEWIDLRNVSLMSEHFTSDLNVKKMLSKRRKLKSIYVEKIYEIKKTKNKVLNKKKNVPNQVLQKSSSQPHMLDTERHVKIYDREYNNTLGNHQHKGKMEKSVNASRQISRASSNERLHLTKSEKNSKMNSRSVSADRLHKKSKSRDEKDDEMRNATSKALEKRRHKQLQRAVYFAHLCPEKRDLLERSAHVLDVMLSSLWKERKAIRRCRMIIHQESPWRAKLLHLNGLNSFKILYKDLQCKMAWNNSHLNVDNSWFELYTGGVVREDRFSIIETLVSETDGKLSDQKYSCEMQKSADMLQSFVRAIVLASRVRQWHQVLQSANEFWRAHLCIFANSFVLGTSLKSHLWRGLFTVGTVLLDMIENINLRKATAFDITDLDSPTDGLFTVFDKLSLFPSCEMKTIQSESDHFNIKLNGILPLDSLGDLMQNKFVGEWLTVSGDCLKAIVDLSLCVKICLSAVEFMSYSKKFNRLRTFCTRFNVLFKGLYGPVISDAVNESKLALEKEEFDYEQLELPLIKDRLWSELINCRKLNTNLMYKVSKTLNKEEVEKEYTLCCIAYCDLLTHCEEIGSQSLPTKYKSELQLLQCLATNEYGDLHLNFGDAKSAAYLWSNTLDIIFSKNKAILNWRQILKMLPELEEISTKSLLMAASVAVKMAQFVYHSDIDRKFDLVQFATSLFSFPMTSALPHPENSMEFLTYEPSVLFPGLEIFSNDKFSSLPLLSMFYFIADKVLESSSLLAKQKLLKCEVYINLGYFSEAIKLMQLLSSGHFLHNQDKKKVLNHQMTKFLFQNSFDNNVSPTDFNNLKILKNFLNLEINEKIAVHYKKPTLKQFELIKNKLVLKLFELFHIDDPLFVDGKLTPLRFNELFLRSRQSSTERGFEMQSAESKEEVDEVTDSELDNITKNISKRNQLEPNVIKRDVDFLMTKIETTLFTYLTEGQNEIAKVQSSWEGEVQNYIELHQNLAESVFESYSGLSKVYKLRNRPMDSLIWYNQIISNFKSPLENKLHEKYALIADALYSHFGVGYCLKINNKIASCLQSMGLTKLLNDSSEMFLKEAEKANSTYLKYNFRVKNLLSSIEMNKNFLKEIIIIFNDLKTFLYSDECFLVEYNVLKLMENLADTFSVFAKNRSEKMESISLYCGIENGVISRLQLTDLNLSSNTYSKMHQLLFFITYKISVLYYHLGICNLALEFVTKAKNVANGLLTIPHTYFRNFILHESTIILNSNSNVLMEEKLLYVIYGKLEKLIELNDSSNFFLNHQIISQMIHIRTKNKDDAAIRALTENLAELQSILPMAPTIKEILLNFEQIMQQPKFQMDTNQIYNDIILQIRKSKPEDVYEKVFKNQKFCCNRIEDLKPHEYSKLTSIAEYSNEIFSSHFIGEWKSILLTSESKIENFRRERFYKLLFKLQNATNTIRKSFVKGNSVASWLSSSPLQIKCDQRLIVTRIRSVSEPSTANSPRCNISSSELNPQEYNNFIMFKFPWAITVFLKKKIKTLVRTKDKGLKDEICEFFVRHSTIENFYMMESIELMAESLSITVAESLDKLFDDTVYGLSQDLDLCNWLFLAIGLFN